MQNVVVQIRDDSTNLFFFGGADAT